MSRIIPNYLKSSSSCADGIVFYGTNPSTQKVEAKAYTGNQSKPVWHFAFKTEESRQAKINQWLSDREATAKIKTDAKQAQKARKREIVSQISVGTILYRTWGYDQTNVDFFQVISVGKASLVVREIAYSRETTGFDCGYATPEKDKFISDELRVSPTKYSVLDRPKVSISWYA